MSRFIAAFLASMLATGITSAVRHELTLLGASGAAVLLTMLSLLNRRVQVYPLLLVLPIGLCIICLISSEVNYSPHSSTIHVLSCYATLIAFSVATTDYSAFCRSFMLQTNIILVVWILFQAMTVQSLGAWKINGVASAGNLMAAQINMTLPLVVTYVIQTRGLQRLACIGLAAGGVIAVVCVMSRNGIGALMIVTLLFALFHRKKLAILSLLSITTVLTFMDEILAMPFVSELLTRMRLMGFKADVSRLTIWDISVASIQRNPMLGLGPGKQKQLLAVLDIDHAHNNVIQVAIECGVPAMILFILILIALARIPAETLFRRRDMFVLSLPVVSYFVFSITSCPLHYPQMTLLLAACVNEARVAGLIGRPGIQPMATPRVSALPGAARVTPVRQPARRRTA